MSLSNPQSKGHSSSHPELATKDMNRLAERILNTDRPGFAQVGKLIEVLAADALELSVEELATLIEAEPPVAAQVLKVAKTYEYNPSGAPVSSVSEAVQVIGFTKIRMFGMSLLMMENFVRRPDTAEMQMLEAVTLASGIMAIVLDEREGGGQPDLCFLAAVLRNFGRISLAGAFPDEYRKVAELEQAEGAQAFARHFGGAPVDLSRELLKGFRISRVLRKSLYRAEEAPGRGGDSLSGRAEFLLRLTELALNAKVDASSFAAQVHSLCESDGVSVGVGEQMIEVLFRATEEGMREFARMFEVPRLAEAVTACLEARRSGRPLPEDGLRLRTWRSMPAGPADEESQASQVWLDTWMQAAEALAVPEVRVEVVANLIAEAVAKVQRADEVIVWGQEGQGGFRSLGGSGKRWSASPQDFHLRLGDFPVLAQAVARGSQAPVVDMADRGAPACIGIDLNVRACLVVPWGEPMCLVLFVGWRTNRPVSLPETDLRILRALLAMVQSARRLRETRPEASKSRRYPGPGRHE